jgi:ABC-type multidrug transport system ATPase subunit
VCSIDSKRYLRLYYVLTYPVFSGELVAIMGPSGSGKSTLINSLAHRALPKKSTLEGQILINRAPASLSAIRHLSCYVEQEDSLIGSLTARETLDFAAKLSLPSSVKKAERKRRVDNLLESFGLQDQADTIIGTPIRKGLSGGQKRRVGIASQLITGPKILFLDEPTSGLDSTASYEVIRYLKDVVKRNRIIVIASIHQPSTSTYTLFDNLFLLSKGKTCFAGPIVQAPEYFEGLGHPMPMHTNPAEFLLDLTNVDFASDKEAANKLLDEIHASWDASAQKNAASQDSVNEEKPAGYKISHLTGKSKLLIPFTLLHRNFIKSYRDVFAYGIRIAMYLGKFPLFLYHLRSKLTKSRPSNNDGHRLAAPRHNTRRHPTLCQLHLLRSRLHLLHGRRLRPRLPRRPPHLPQRARKRPLRPHRLHNRQFPHRTPLPLPHLAPLQHHHLLAVQFPAERYGIHDVDYVAVFGFGGGGEFGRVGVEFVSDFCGRVGVDGVREWVVDVRRGFSGEPESHQCVLEVLGQVH